MGGLLFYVVVFVVSLPFLLLLFRENKGPIQFTLRTLFVVVTVMALILGGIGWWRTANLAQLRWLDPTSPEAVALFRPCEIVRTNRGEWSIDYHPQRSSIRFETTSVHREWIESQLRALQDADTLGPGEMVLRGRVEDSGGEPAAGVKVDLMGPCVRIGLLPTGEDGTFVMPMKGNEDWRYYLRIRSRGAKPRNTARFSLSYDAPERVVIVRLP